MRPRSFRTAFLFLAFACVCLVFYKPLAHAFRSRGIQFYATDEQHFPDGKELQRLQLENNMIKNELKALRNHFGEDLGYIFYMDFDVVPAKVIFRSPIAWESSLWINVGKATNAQMGREVVAYHSPVVEGKSIVGVVDYVGEKQSRVRLITDSGLTPAVRAARGKLLLAKGEVHGSSQPLWRSQRHLLKGTGFNYDFPDRAIPEGVELVKEGDLLVTTGLDGVFPPHLQVGKVTKVFPAQEGDYFWELEAEPSASQLDELDYVFVLKPVGYEADDKPPHVVW